jgi:hypothetical protein
MDGKTHIEALRLYRIHQDVANFIYHYNTVERLLSSFIFGMILGAIIQ